MISAALIGTFLVAGSLGHVTQASYSTIAVEEDRLQVELRLACSDLARKGEAFARPGPDLARYAGESFDLRVDGGPSLVGRVSSMESRFEAFGLQGSGPRSWMLVRIDYTLAGAPREIDIASRLFLDVDSEHRHLTRVRRQSGESCLVIGPGQSVSVTLAESGRWTGFLGFYRTGIAHILGGFDHLLFLVMLLLLSRSVGALVRTVTAFSVAHCATLALTVLGFVRVPGSWVECAIALSIVYVAVEVIAGETVPTWASAFVFGLFHGMGFASGLARLDWASTGIVPALLGFNLGVETGQLLVVGSLFPLLAYARARLPRAFPWLAAPVAAFGVLAATVWLYARWPS